MEDLDTALTHPSHELVVLELRPLDPSTSSKSSSSWLDGVSRVG
jgi:hypothetical protein